MSGEFDEARVKLVMRQPFFGTLILHLPEREMSSEEMMMTQLICGQQIMPTAAVVYKKVGDELRPELWYAKEFVESMSKPQRQGLLAHEVLHLALGHCFEWRRGTRDPDLWNEATDFVVNLIVRDAGLELPSVVLPDGKKIVNGCYDEAYRGMSAEEVYSKLKAKPKKKQPQGCNGFGEVVMVMGKKDDKGKGKGKGQEKDDKKQDGKGQQEKAKGPKVDEKDLTGAGKEKGQPQQPEPDDGEGDGEGDMVQIKMPEGMGSEEEAKWKNLLVRAVLVAKMQGKCPAGMERLVEDLLQPRIPWQALMERYLSEIMRTDYDWMRHDRRYMGGTTIIGVDGKQIMGPAVYLPDLLNEGTDVAVAVDTSGSIGQDVLRGFVSEIVGMLRARNVRKIRLMACDAEVTLDEEITATSVMPKKFPGGGGTDFRPVFDLLKKSVEKPKVLVYCTDLYGSFPEASDKPDYPVIWLSVTRDYEVPFGEVIHYELPEEVPA